MQLNAAFPTDREPHAAVLDRAGRHEVPLFSGLASNGANFINTTFDDAAENSITAGTAPFSGPFQARPASSRL